MNYEDTSIDTPRVDFSANGVWRFCFEHKSVCFETTAWEIYLTKQNPLSESLFFISKLVWGAFVRDVFISTTHFFFEVGSRITAKFPQTAVNCSQIFWNIWESESWNVSAMKLQV